MTKKRTEEDKTIQYLERRYCYEQRQSLYIANEETNQVWDETDIPDFIQAWNNNWSLSEIADYLGADHHEIQLLAADLIKQGKIEGNIHIFKPKRRKAHSVETISIGGSVIRATLSDNEYWVCLKDVWYWIGKKTDDYKTITDTWGPDQRAKYVVPTDNGPSKFIFVNAAGLDRLRDELEPWQQLQANRIIARVQAATENATKRKRKSKARRKSG